MGWLHINKIGKGVYLAESEFSFEQLETLIPPTSWLSDHLVQFDLRHFETLSVRSKLVYLSFISDDVYISYSIRKASDITDENIQNVFDPSTVLPALSLLFCYKYSFPIGSFCCLADYSGEWMFFSNIQYPPIEYNESIANLTEPTYISMLEEFFSLVYKEPKHLKLELCEEYIKE